MDDAFFEPVLDAAHDMDSLTGLSDASFGEVEKSAELFSRYYDEIRPYRVMLDLWVSQFFGSEIPRDELRIWGNMIAAHILRKGRPGEASPKRRGPTAKTIERWTEQAAQVAGEPWKRFFHWELEFPEVYFRNKQRVPDAGFDVVLGNPPYIKYQNRDDSPEFKAWYNSNYLSAHGNYDVYVLFVERALGLLRPGGRHGYIVYNKWLVSEYGQKLRGLLAERRAVSEIVDFTDNQVFADHTTYTCLLFVSRDEQPYLRYTRLPLLGNEREVAMKLPQVIQALDTARSRGNGHIGAASRLAAALSGLGLPGRVLTCDFDTAEFSDDPWAFSFGADRDIRRKTVGMGRPLLSLTRDSDGIAQGLITSADSIYIVDHIRDLGDGRIRVWSPAKSAPVDVEAAMFRPLVSGEDIDRYALAPTRKLILFPYKISNSGARLMSVSEVQRYPSTWEYLCSFEADLRSRESSAHEGAQRPFDDNEWYRFGRNQGLDKQHLPKLCVAQTVTRLEVALDLKGEFCTHNVRVNSIILDRNADADGYWYLLALLNGKLLDWCFKTGPVGRHAQGHYAANRQFIKDLPVYVPQDHTSEDRKRVSLEEFTKRRASTKSDPELADLTDWCDSAFLVGRRRADDAARDVLVWLAQRMERGTRKRQEERSDFLTYLSGELGADWETLSGKSDLARYDEIPPERVMEILRSPANVAQYNAAGQRGMAERSRILREAIEREHRKSVRKLQRRSAMLDHNQRLIDHIVYRLYGLNDDEIAVVEGGPAH